MIQLEITTTEVGTTEQVTTLVEVAGAGPQGPIGPQGPVGPGLPAGGTEFQLIEKASGTDYDTRWTSEPTVDGILFDTTAGLEAEAEGELVWDDDAGTIDLGMNDGVLQRVGEDTFYRVQADEAISKGDVLMSVGTVGNSGVILVAKSRPTYNGNPVISQQLMGLAPADIAQGERGYALAFGRLRKFNTNAFEEGDILWADPTVAGGLTKIKPEAPNWRVIIALVVTKSIQVGSLQVRPTFGGSLADDELVYINGITDNQILRYNSATERFEAESLGTAADADTGDFATAAQGLLADTATQPGDNISTLTNDANYIDASGAPVQSVNAQTGAVVLTATDVGAYPDTNPNGYIDASGAPVQSVDGLTGTVDLSGNYDALGSASAVQSNLDTHVGDTTNPHSVTKTQVGLGNVDNVSAADLRDRSTHTGTQPATTVTYSNATSGLTATDVQGALDEVVVNGLLRRFRYIATQDQTTFTGSDSNGNTLAYYVGQADVYVNGVRIDQTDFTATDGTSIVLSQGLDANDELVVLSFGVYSVADINAVDVDYSNVTSGLSATTVQAAIDEKFELLSASTNSTFKSGKYPAVLWAYGDNQILTSAQSGQVAGGALGGATSHYLFNSTNTSFGPRIEISHYSLLSSGNVQVIFGVDATNYATVTFTRGVFVTSQTISGVTTSLGSTSFNNRAEGALHKSVIKMSTSSRDGFVFSNGYAAGDLTLDLDSAFALGNITYIGFAVVGGTTNNAISSIGIYGPCEVTSP